MVGLRTQLEAVAHRRDWHVEFVGPRAPGQQPLGSHTRRQRRAGQRGALAILQRYRIAREDLGGRAVAQQIVNRELGQQHAAKAAFLTNGHLQQQHRCRLAGCQRLREHGLLQVARHLEQLQQFLFLDHLIKGEQVLGRHAGAELGGAHLTRGIDPGQCLQLCILADQRIGTVIEAVLVHVLVAHIAGQAHQLLLALGQAQPNALLGIFHIPAHGLAFAFQLLTAQVPKGRDDRDEEHHHRHQWSNGRIAVLSRR